ncbi:MAG TPA: ketosamine-3-kinase, partial [Algoriphagus sp.]|nr:ketosamine-3-kinase [Algoriphagus sp.]
DHVKDILYKEAEGLDLLRKSTFIKIPNVLRCGRVGDYNYLLSEFIPSGRYQLDYWENLGLGLAHLHLTNQKKYGLEN